MENQTLNLIVGTAASITTILGAWLLIAKFVVPVIKRIKDVHESFERFMRDWSGTEEEPGRDEVPGVMERLNRIDGELKNNGGSTIKDAVERIEKRIDNIDNRLEEIDKRLIEGEERFDKISEDIKSIENSVS